MKHINRPNRLARLLCGASLALAACAHAPRERPVDGPPVTIAFAPPRDGALLELMSQERSSTVHFAGQSPRTVKETVHAVRHEPQLGPVLEIVLRFGGRKSPLADEPGARDVLARLPKEAVLADEADGGGNRLVSVLSCRVLSEEARIEGALLLKKEKSEGMDPSAVPEKIAFRVHRSARRPDGPEATRVNVPVVTPITSDVTNDVTD